MSVDQSKIIDLIGVEKESGDVLLTISDHLDWSDTRTHQRILQDKLNTYLAFIESGEIFQSYPDSKNRRAAINLALKYEPDDEGRNFLNKARVAIEAAGFIFRYEIPSSV
jgi:uncharacterized protein DUF6572